jgi:copper chaperone CopZ
MSQRNTTLNVTGMTCGGCVRHVSSALAALPGVSKVKVQLRAGIVEVQHGDETTLPALIGAVQDAGYDAQPQAERQSALR